MFVSDKTQEACPANIVPKIFRKSSMRAFNCISMAFLLLVVGGAHAAEPPDITGLWRSVRDFGPDVSGRLTIVGTRAGRRAEIGGRSAPVTVDRAGWRFALPDNHGQFRGTLRNTEISGFWIQPATMTLGVDYASPIVLHKSGRDNWSGDVAPLQDRLTLYLQIGRQADGTLAGFIRNPELNFGRGRPLAITLTGDEVGIGDSARHQTNMQGRYDAGTRVLMLTASPMNIDFAFARVDAAHAPGFAPRMPAAPYVYRAPLPQDDGWHTGTLEKAGIDESAVTVLIRRIADTQPGAGATPYIDSLLIARHGKLVLEEYFDGFDSETPHTLRSASKSVSSMLLGAAIDHGAQISPATPMASQFGKYQPFGNPDPRKAQITIENLLTMSSGLACDDDNDNSPGNEDNMQNQTNTRDW